MNDLPEIKNEPTLGVPRDDLQEFARAMRPAPDRPAPQDDEPSKSRFKYVPALLAILLALVVGWHLFAANHIEKQLTIRIGESVHDNLPGVTVDVNVHPLTNLVELQFTRSMSHKEAAFEFFGDVILEFARQELEPKMERELSIVARRDTDLYAMLVPYKVSISIDKVRAQPLPPPSRMVQEIQRQLGARGYEPGPADGRLGERTRQAIESFQRDHGMAVDGRATGELLDTLRKE